MLTATSSRLLPVRTFKIATGIAAGLLLYSGPTLITCEALSGVQSALIARQSAALHGLLIGVSAGIACVVFAILIHSVLAYRGGSSPGAIAFRRQPVREALWAFVPFVIVLAMAWPAVSSLRDGSLLTETGVVAGFSCQAGAISASSTLSTR